MAEKICVSVSEPDAARCIKALKGLRFAEIRLDEMKVSADEVRAIFSSEIPLIATCRPDGRSDAERKRLLLAAIDGGAAYVDVELEAPASYRKDILAAARKNACKAIISYHNYERTPERAELERIRDSCFDSGADIAKIACMANSNADNARLLGLLDTERKLVVIGMGKKGRITRVLAPLLGSEFTFASQEKGKKTAPGQIGMKELEKMLKVLADG